MFGDEDEHAGAQATLSGFNVGWHLPLGHSAKSLPDWHEGQKLYGPCAGPGELEQREGQKLCGPCAAPGKLRWPGTPGGNIGDIGHSIVISASASTAMPKKGFIIWRLKQKFTIIIDLLANIVK